MRESNSHGTSPSELKSNVSTNSTNPAQVAESSIDLESESYRMHSDSLPSQRH